MNYSSPLNPFTSDKRSRIQAQAEDDAVVLYGMRLKIEAAIERGLHLASLDAMDLQVLDETAVMDALRKQFDPAILMDSFVDGFYAARKTLSSITGQDFSEPPMDAEPTQQLAAE